MVVVVVVMKMVVMVVIVMITEFDGAQFLGRCQHLGGHEVDLRVELLLHRPLYPQPIGKRVPVPILHLKFIPSLPKRWFRPIMMIIIVVSRCLIHLIVLDENSHSQDLVIIRARWGTDLGSQNCEA